MTALPTSKLERWKYSNLPAFLNDNYTDTPLVVTQRGGDAVNVPLDCAELHKPICQWPRRDNDLWATLPQAHYIAILEGDQVNEPIHLSSVVRQGEKAAGHILIMVADNCEAVIYDDMDVSGWCNRSVTIGIGKNARVTHIRTGSGAGVYTSLSQIHIQEGGTYSSYALLNYGAFVRDQYDVQMTGENAICAISGAKILSGQQHSDTTIQIDHRAPHCYSNQNYRNILDGQARGVFQGKVYVSREAQKTDGYQLCNSILLSERAEMMTKPELEIYADDVKCSHGATTAQLDDGPLFYLRARGIPEHQAKSMMLEAFLMESIEPFSDQESVYDGLAHAIRRTIDS